MARPTVPTHPPRAGAHTLLAARPDEIAVPSTGTRAPRVLIVDDDADLRHLVNLYLGRLGGFDVVGEAADGEQAIAQAGALQPDVVLLDIMMPGMSGRDALPGVVRAAPDAMVLMLSALGSAANEEATLAAGAFAYVEKSTLGTTFGEQVHRMLADYRASRPAD